MKLCRFDDNRLGLVKRDHVLDVSAALDVLPSLRYPLPPGDLLVAHLGAVVARVRELAPKAAPKPLASCALLSPVANPPRIIAAPVKPGDVMHCEIAGIGAMDVAVRAA